MRGRKLERDPSAERIADECRLRQILRLHKAVEKIGKRSDSIIEERLVGLAKANLIDRIDVILGSQRRKVPQPNFLHRTQSVQQNHYWSLPALEIVNVLAVNGRYFFRRQSLLRLRIDKCSEKESCGESTANVINMHPQSQGKL